MPIDTNGVFARSNNSFSEPVIGTTISPADAMALFDDFDAALNGDLGTSTTSLDIATVVGAGTATLVTQTSKRLVPGRNVKAFSAAAPTNYIAGVVSTYTAGSLVMTGETSGGSGTVTDWVIWISGASGATGAAGPVGATSGIKQTYSTTTTDADPGNGTFRLNNATPASATAAYLDNLDSGGATVSGIFDLWDDSTTTVRGIVRFEKSTDPTVWAQFQVTGSIVDGTGYRKVTLANGSGSGAFTNGNTFAITFTRTGDAGAGTGTVTSVVAGTGLTGGTITATGTIAIDGTFGFRNRVINPSGQIWQTSPTTSIADVVYDFDQWITLTQTNPITASQQTNVESGTPYMMRSLQANASAQRFGRIQWLEAANVLDLRGQTVTLSARVRMSASTTLRYSVIEWTGTADSPVLDVVNDWTSGTFTTGNFFKATTTTIAGASSTALTANTAASVSLTCAVSASANNVALMFWTYSTQAQNVTLDIGKVQLEIGSSATPLAFRSIQDELNLALRYFKRFSDGVGQYLVIVQAVSATDTIGPILFVPHMRIAPSIAVSAAGDFALRDASGTPLTCTAVTLISANTRTARLRGQVTTGLVAGNATSFESQSAGSPTLDLSARL